jgi:hypothetical protein
MKLPRFSSFKHPDKNTSEETKPDISWSQHVSLPLHPAAAEYDRHLKAGGKPDLVSKSAAMIAQGNNARFGNEHILSALGDLIRALDIDGKEVIDYILANDLVKGEATEEP